MHPVPCLIGAPLGGRPALGSATPTKPRSRARLEENAVEVGYKIATGTPKTQERRTIVYPSFLSLAMASSCSSKPREALLWDDGKGNHLGAGNRQSGWFTGAAARARAEDWDMPRVSPHDLRHSSASLATSAEANVKAVRRMLGHASAAMTLDVYADLFEDDLDSVADALSRQRAADLA